MNLFALHDNKCNYAKRPFRTFDAAKKTKNLQIKINYFFQKVFNPVILTKKKFVFYSFSHSSNKKTLPFI